ncbi:MAG: septum formation initiator family protein [Bacilli bacterium]|nr:septum formation initiator family protein [Bacilli bacterium]MDD4547673.1 septum formation initiator family protein [Bacilli bacterium]
MAVRRISKASKRRIMTFGIASIFMILYFFVNSVQYIININKLENEEKRLAQELSDLKSEESNLKTEIQKLQDPDYIARYARENYLYSKDGEYVIRIEPKEPEEKEAESKINYKQIGLLSVGGIAVAYFIIRSKK